MNSDHEQVFVSYSRKDQMWVDEKNHPSSDLVPWLKKKLANQGMSLWWDAKLSDRTGDDYRTLIEAKIEGAQVAVVLISDDFFMSSFISSIELPLIKKRVEAGLLRLFPIVVSHVDWDQSEYAQWIKSRHIHPSSIKPLIDIFQKPAEWSRVRSEISIALREQVTLASQSSSRKVEVESAEPRQIPRAPTKTLPAPSEPPKKSSSKWVYALVAGVGVIAAALFVPRYWNAYQANRALSELDITNEQFRQLSPKIGETGAVSLAIADIEEIKRLEREMSRAAVSSNKSAVEARSKICESSNLLQHFSYRLYFGSSYKAAGKQLANTSVDMLMEDGAYLDCSNTDFGDMPWRAPHYAGEIARRDGNLLKAQDLLEAATTEANKLKQKAGTNVRSYFFELRLELASLVELSEVVRTLDREMGLKYAHEAFQICSREAMVGGAVSIPLRLFDFGIPDANSARDSNCNRATEILDTDYSQEIGERTTRAQANLTLLFDEREQAVNLSDFGKATSLMQSALAEIDSEPGAAFRLMDQRVRALTQDGFINLLYANKPYGLSQLSRAFLFSKNNEVSQVWRDRAIYELARSKLYLPDSPYSTLQNEALATTRSAPEASNNHAIVVTNYLVLASLAKSAGDSAEALRLARLALTATADKSIGQQMDAKGIEVSKQTASQLISWAEESRVR
jgi:hypothetical protein